MTKPKKQIVQTNPGVSAFEGVQLSLFQGFLCNTQEEREKLSNTIELWDAIPKYSVTPQNMNKVRTKDGFLPLLEKKFVYKKNEYKVTISPAQIKEADGVVSYYPSVAEEIVEDCLRRISAEQNNGFYDELSFKSGVVFSINLLRNELKKREHTRSHKDTVRSLYILAGSHIEIELPNGKGFAKTNYLPSLAAVSRTQWEEDPDAKWMAQFHPLVTQGIGTAAFRQYNFNLMMTHTSHLSRWFHKLLSHNYVNASIVNPYKTSLSSIKRDSGLIDCKRMNDEVRKLESCFDELKEHKVLLSYEKSEKRGPRKMIIDIEYSLLPHNEFVRDIKAANKRQQIIKEGGADIDLLKYNN